MKKIILKEVVLGPGMEYQWTSYPGDGIYWLANRNQLAVVSGASSVLVSVLPSLITEDVVGVGGCLSESFVLTLIDKTAELMKYQATRAVRKTDNDSDVRGGSNDAKG